MCFVKRFTALYKVQEKEGVLFLFRLSYAISYDVLCVQPSYDVLCSILRSYGLIAFSMAAWVFLLTVYP